MTNIDPRLVEMERQHRDFWAAQATRRSAQMADVGLRKAAFRILEDEQERVPIHNRLTLEQALDDAEKYRVILAPAAPNRRDGQTAAEIGRKGGRAKRSDPLQDLIIKIVADKPQITVRQLMDELRAYSEIRDVVEDIDEKSIHFLDRQDRPKTASISGLKDRLTRARKSLQSR